MDTSQNLGSGYSDSGQQVDGALPSGSDNPLTGVWAELVGQQRAVSILRRAVAGDAHSMTHSWLITGPPGSGRSNAAKAFATALQCPDGGCGHCNECRTALSGAHPDVTLVRTEKLSIGVDEVRDLVRTAAMAPTLGSHQVIVIEDADRLTDSGADALLKSLEEPPARTVWILCAPTPDDVIVTIRSRCRQIGLRTPTDQDVVKLLVERDGIEQSMAEYAAKAAQGHIGRARGLARDEESRAARRHVLRVPLQLKGIGSDIAAAEQMLKTAQEETSRATSRIDARERAELEEALGYGTKGKRPREGAALRDLEKDQKTRAKRFLRDAIDRNLTELTTWYRDVLSVQTGAVDPNHGFPECDIDNRQPGMSAQGGSQADESGSPSLINVEMRQEIVIAARATSPEHTLRCIDAILECRQALEYNVDPRLALEALFVQLDDQQP